MNFLALAPLLLLMAAPFWESKPPAQWTDAELQQMFINSPWAQLAPGEGTAQPPPPVLVYLATAAPMEQAEKEVARREQLRRKPGTPAPDSAAATDPLVSEYRAWLQDNRATQIVLAIRIPARGPNDPFSDEREVKRMQDECVMHVGRKKFKLTGHFPPTAADPFLRLAFPRQAGPNDKRITFDLYVPGIPGPYRTVEFTVKDMILNGKLEM